ncbi:Retrovirus-related Pol polyprotein from transposon 17.6 [Vitis vinifera]|uniref:Retrovirus-related Pol polyprotein from transposon 17.6 n=1 Tax=Vitis vinifera TaxID=29760 RepID=A0A438H9E3_VITVI|nr:Retrovirus-related Pol polyprotein from transposon 17.6 [Vitis vinifera]
MTRRLEELELKKMHEVQAVAETPVQVKPCPICQSYEHLVEECPTIPAVGNVWRSSKCHWTIQAQYNARMEILTTQVGGIIQISHGSQEHLSTNTAQPSQQASSLEQAIVNLSKIDNLQYSISRLTNLNTVQEKGRFPSQPHQNPKGIHEVETHEENLHRTCTIKRGLNVNKKAFLTEQVSAIIQCKSPLKYKDPGCPTISVMIGGKVVEKALLDLGASVNLLPYSVYKQLGLGELKPTSITLSLADRSVKIPRGLEEEEEILPLFNKEEAQEAAKEETPKLNLKPLPMEKCLLEVLKRCKKAIGWQISDLKGISPLRWCELSAEATSSRYYLPISDSPWVSPTQVVPKKSGITVVQNEKGEEITTRLTSVLERVSGHPFYCFLDGYSGYFQIEIDVEDQEKTTFTCPFGTYAYRRMPFGLCNAPATFQRCMLSIFSDMVERIMEVFMDDITIYGGIEVDKAKVELIVKLPPPTTVKGVRQFLGHAVTLLWSCAWPKRRWKALCDLLCKQDIERSSKELHNYRERIVSVVFALDKFRPYLSSIFKSDKKGVENVVADHLSRLVIAHNSHVPPINDDFPEESLMLLTKTPWYAHIANYLVTGEVPNQIIRKCVPEEEQQGILSHCHESACGGHFASQKTAMKCCNQGLLGHHFSKMPTSCVGAVIDAKGLGS